MVVSSADAEPYRIALRAFQEALAPKRADVQMHEHVLKDGAQRERILAGATRREDIAPFFGPLSAAEVRHLMAHEWARTADDVLWRRSKLGLSLGATEKAALVQFMAGEAAAMAHGASTHSASSPGRAREGA